MQIKDCSFEDIPLLAKMNQQLIEDEKAVGYALCNMSKNPVYLRQFFICRDPRRKGYGKQA